MSSKTFTPDSRTKYSTKMPLGIAGDQLGVQIPVIVRSDGHVKGSGHVRDLQPFGDPAHHGSVRLEDIGRLALQQFRKAPARSFELAGRDRPVDGLGDARHGGETIRTNRLFDPIRLASSSRRSAAMAVFESGQPPLASSRISTLSPKALRMAFSRAASSRAGKCSDLQLHRRESLLDVAGSFRESSARRCLPGDSNRR